LVQVKDVNGKSAEAKDGAVSAAAGAMRVSVIARRHR